MIVVTAPSGRIGSQLLPHLLDAGEAVRVIERRPERLPVELSGRVEVVEGSHGDAAVVSEAFRGADRVFWLCPANPGARSVEEAYVGFTRPAAEAMKKEGVKRAVVITALGRGTPQARRAGHVTASLAADDLIAGSGVALRELTMPSFMDNILMQLNPIREKGLFFSPISGDRKLPACATRDIAGSAATLLLDPSWTGRDHLAVLGPEDISFNDMARTMSEVLARPIRFQQIPLEDYRKQFLSFGFSEAMAQAMADMAEAKENGLDNAEPRTPENTTPTSFRQWCEAVLKPAMAG